MNSCNAKMNVGGGIGRATDSVSAQTPVASSIDVLARNLDQLEQSVQLLIQKLQPVRNERPQPNQKLSEQPIAPKSNIVNTLDAFSTRIRVVREATDIVISEIEI